MDDSNRERVYSRIKRTEILFLALIVLTLLLATVGDQPEWKQRDMAFLLRWPLGIVLISSAVTAIAKCETYGKFILEKRVERYRAFYENWYGTESFTYQSMFSKGTWVAGIVFVSLFLSFIGFVLIVLMPR